MRKPAYYKGLRGFAISGFYKNSTGLAFGGKRQAYKKARGGCPGAFKREKHAANLHQCDRQNQRQEYDRRYGNKLNQYVDGRTGRVFERVADRVADDGRFVRFASLAAEIAGFNVLFGVVPRAAALAEA